MKPTLKSLTNAGASTLLGVLALVAIPIIAGSQPPTAGKRPDDVALQAATAFDKDLNGKLDPGELAELNKALAAAPTGPLAALDENKNGKIDQAETKALRSGRSSPVQIRQFDRDGNHKIEGKEVESLRAQFSAAASNRLKALDRNRDSKLDDSEIAALNARLARQSGRKGRGKDAPVPAPVASPEPDTGTGSAALRWEPPTLNTDGTALKNLAGYVIRYGRSPGALTHRIVVNDPKATGYVIDNLGNGTWYITVSALAGNGIESHAGPILSKTIGPATAPK